MEIVLTSMLAFIATNVDDVFLLMLFFGNKRFKDREIIMGQYLGIATLITISLALSFIGLIIDKAYIGLLGLLPIYVGVRTVIQLTSTHTDDEPGTEPKSDRNNMLAVSGVTIANGGDNIGIYVPLFATLALTEKLTMISVFLIMTGVWCLLAKYVTRHPLVAKAIDRYGHAITPFVLILLGVYILYESKTWSIFHASY